MLEDDLKEFHTVEIEIMLKDEGQSIQCRGNIAWVVKKKDLKGAGPVVKYDTGVEFVNINQADKKRIETIVNSITHI